MQEMTTTTAHKTSRTQEGICTLGLCTSSFGRQNRRWKSLFKISAQALYQRTPCQSLSVQNLLDKSSTMPQRERSDTHKVTRGLRRRISDFYTARTAPVTQKSRLPGIAYSSQNRHAVKNTYVLCEPIFENRRSKTLALQKAAKVSQFVAAAYW